MEVYEMQKDGQRTRKNHPNKDVLKDSRIHGQKLEINLNCKVAGTYLPATLFLKNEEYTSV